MRKKRLWPLLASFLSFLLIFSSFATPIGAMGLGKIESSLPSSKQLEATVSQDVYDAFKKQDFVEIIVEMKEQVDTSLVANKAKFQMNQQVKPYEEKLATKYAVINTLKQTAERTQESLIEQLAKNKQVKDYKSFYIMNVVYAKTTEEMVEKIKKNPEVKRITLDKKIEVNWPKPTETEFNQSVSKLENILTEDEDPTVEWNIDHINAPQVWNEFGIDGSGVVVGIIDSGAHWSHEALMDKWRGYNRLDPNNPTPEGNWFDAVEGRSMPYDISQPHGTHVLGTILGQGPNGENKIGVAPGAKWIAARAFTIDGGQQSWLLAAGEFMLAPNGDPNLAPDIINNSWGGGPGLDEWYRPMVQAWRDSGILPVFAAGNDYPSKVSAPANYPESYAVAATDVNNQRGGFSNVGPGPYNDDLKPDISAPGVNIRSSVPNGYQGGWNGTSMATPHISGVAALLLSVDTNLKVDRIEEIINQTATPLTDNQYPEAPNYGYGNGLVNAYEAVSSIATGAGGITGTVLKEGIDEEEPEIIHEEDLFGYKSLDFLLEAQVTDNISVVKTELLIRQNKESEWESFPFERTSGNFLDGNYQVKVPQSYVEVPGFQYKIRATDFSGNSSESKVYDVQVAFGIDPNNPLKHGFETELEGMLVSEDWQRGIPTVGPSPTEGENLVATNLTGNYSNQSNSVLQLPPLDLRNVTEASLSFKHWFDIEHIYDVGKVLVTDDIHAQEWYVAETFTGRERTWNDFTLNLSEYANSENQVYVALLLESDHQTSHAGWYIDELSIDTTVEEGTNVSGESVKLESTLPVQQSLPNEISISNSESGLPVEAFVTVLETGRTAKTSLQDGSYSILHSPTPDGETYTLRVESYGYYPEEVEFVLNEEETLEENFLLEEIPKGEIAVTVVDSNNVPLEGVSLEIVEDSRIEPSETNDNGTSSFQDVLEGTYTLRVTHDNYHAEVVEVNVIGGETTQVEVELERFPGTVIQYDDGTAENARAFVDAGLGYATKMSTNQEAQIVGASVFLWGEDWPYPGGNEFSITIYESDDEGNPGQRVFEPKVVEGVRGTWNYVDLSEFEFSTGQDYYVVVIQTNAFEQSPGIGVDESSPFQDRTYIFDNGTFDKLGSQYGNFMIRSHVQYVTSSPVIDNAAKKHYSNEDSFHITGTVDSDGIVTIYNNGAEIASAMTTNKEFAFEVALQEGENSISATVTTNETESEHSEPIVVIQDVTLPEITIEQVPTITNEESLTLAGKATDTNLEKVTINDQDVEILADSSFHYEVGLVEGLNTIEVIATDLAGNQSDSVVEIELDTVTPVITSVTPNKDIYLSPGDSLQIKLMSDTSNGNATVTVKDAESKTISRITMKETEATTYEIDWIIPTDLTSVTLHFELEDEAGNIAAIQANGSVIVGEKDARIFGHSRFDTAIEVSKLGWKSADTVILARGDEYADTLAGIPLAHQLNAPVLLTHSNKLYGPTKGELVSLGAKKVIILGGEIAISSQVEQELLDSGIEVDRIAGHSRVETAGLIAERLTLDTNKAVIVNAMDFPDALSVASFAAMENLPILLSYTDKLPKATADLLEENNITETIVVGGEVAVSENVYKQLPNPKRISGHDRYETNVELFNHFNPDSSKVYVATGRNFADALTGATLSAKNGTGILLTYEKVPEVVKQYIQEQDINQLRIFGGPIAISDDVYDELKRLLDE